MKRFPLVQILQWFRIHNVVHKIYKFIFNIFGINSYSLVVINLLQCLVFKFHFHFHWFMNKLSFIRFSIYSTFWKNQVILTEINDVYYLYTKMKSFVKSFFENIDNYFLMYSSIFISSGLLTLYSDLFIVQIRQSLSHSAFSR